MSGRRVYEAVNPSTASLCDAASLLLERHARLTAAASPLARSLRTPEERKAAFEDELERLALAYEAALRKHDADAFEFSTVRATAPPARRPAHLGQHSRAVPPPTRLPDTDRAAPLPTALPAADGGDRYLGCQPLRPVEALELADGPRPPRIAWLTARRVLLQEA